MGIRDDDDITIRPKRLNEFVGQPFLVKQLEVMINAHKMRKEPLDHLLFEGPPGLGKTTLGNIMANEMGGKIIISSGPSLDRIGLITVLIHLEEADFFFIDEIHRINKTLEEMLYPAMEDFYIDLVVAEGNEKKPKKLKLNRFTLIGATTRSGLLSPPFRERFGFIGRLDLYNIDDLVLILHRSAAIKGYPVTPEGAIEIAKRSRGTPRTANRLLRRIIDYATVAGVREINKEICDKALVQIGIDERGLEAMDRRILEVIIRDFQGGPVGLKNIAVSVCEDIKTLEEYYEPYLIRCGLIKRGLRGREITKKGRNYPYLSPEVKKLKNEEITEIKIKIRGEKDKEKKVEEKVIAGVVEEKTVSSRIPKGIDVDGIISDVMSGIRHMGRNNMVRKDDIDADNIIDVTPDNIIDVTPIIDTTIPIIDKSGIKQKKYKNYAARLSKLIPYFDGEIANSKQGKIMIFIKDLKNNMGESFVGLHNDSFIKGVRYTLSQNKLLLEEVRKGTDDDILIIIKE